jgi:hypothetical protein
MLPISAAMPGGLLSNLDWPADRPHEITPEERAVIEHRVVIEADLLPSGRSYFATQLMRAHLAGFDDALARMIADFMDPQGNSSWVLTLRRRTRGRPRTLHEQLWDKTIDETVAKLAEQYERSGIKQAESLLSDATNMRVSTIRRARERSRKGK